MLKTIFFGVLLLAIVWFPGGIVNAAVIISEIMYDPQGTDTKREWVEIYNDTASSIDGTTLKLIEAGVSHRVTAAVTAVSSIIPAGAYVVIADDAATFMTDYPSYSGLLFDSSFSLSNAGEVLAIEALGQQESSTYDPSFGGAGTSASLQWSDGTFIAATPTPGEENKTSSDEQVNAQVSTTTPSTSTISSHSDTTSVSTYVPKEAFGLSIGRDRITTIQSALLFEASVPTSSSIRYTWNFGDGTTGKGRSVKHIYNTPGVYVVIGRAQQANSIVVDRAQVTVIEPNIEAALYGIASSTATSIEFGVLLTNKGSHELNLGGWNVVLEEEQGRNISKQVVSKDTIVLPGGSLHIPLKQEASCATLVIRYPNASLYSKLNCRPESV